MTSLDRAFDFVCSIGVQPWLRIFVGPLLVLLWLVVITAIKAAFYLDGQVTGDVFIYANAMANTHWPDRFLYIADYQLRSGTTTLLLDHFEPSTVLLLPLFRAFSSPLVLVLFQAIAPLVLVACLIITGRRLGAPPWLGWAVAIFTLFNPLFVVAVIDGPYGFHHDSQFLIYAPLLLTSFLLRRWLWMLVFLILFLGVKEDAAFFGIAFGLSVGLFGLPDGSGRKAGLAVAMISAAWFLLAIVVIPNLVHSPNMYAADGASRMHQGLVLFISTAAHNFIAHGWGKLLLYFCYAVASPPFLLAVLPDIGMYSEMTRAADLYFNFTIVTFLAFGVLLTLRRCLASPSRAVWAPIRKPVILAFAVQTAVAVPLGFWQCGSVWHKSVPDSRPVAIADQRAAWQMVDRSCTVAVSSSLLDRFYRLPYYLQSWHVGAAHEVVDVARQLLTRHADDPVFDYVNAHPGQFTLVGRSGPVAVWRDNAVACFPW